MSETETVEVTFKIPKHLLNVLEQEEYFGWSKQDFYVAATQSIIGAELTAMPFDEMKKVVKKHGFDPGELDFTETKILKSLVYP